jgi:hypothetical protein
MVGSVERTANSHKHLLLPPRSSYLSGDFADSDGKAFSHGVMAPD